MSSSFSLDNFNYEEGFKTSEESAFNFEENTPSKRIKSMDIKFFIEHVKNVSDSMKNLISILLIL